MKPHLYTDESMPLLKGGEPRVDEVWVRMGAGAMQRAGMKQSDPCEWTYYVTHPDNWESLSEGAQSKWTFCGPVNTF